jgi:hypothetical protein
MRFGEKRWYVGECESVQHTVAIESRRSFWMGSVIKSKMVCCDWEGAS